MCGVPSWRQNQKIQKIQKISEMHPSTVCWPCWMPQKCLPMATKWGATSDVKIVCNIIIIQGKMWPARENLLQPKRSGFVPFWHGSWWDELMETRRSDMPGFGAWGHTISVLWPFYEEFVPNYLPFLEGKARQAGFCGIWRPYRARVFAREMGHLPPHADQEVRPWLKTVEGDVKWHLASLPPVLSPWAAHRGSKHGRGHRFGCHFLIFSESF